MKSLNTLQALIVVSATFALTFVTQAGVRESLAEKLPNIELEQISSTPVKDMYSLDLGDRYVYVTADGQYIFNGELIETETRQNLSQVALGKKRIDTIAAIPAANYIVFPAKDKKHSITVFTDIDCTWCRRLHSEIDTYTALGIEVRYLLRPRSGEQSLSWQKADAVFCSKDQLKNLTRAKQGIDIPMKTCENSPVRSNVEIAEKLGLMGTPVVLSEGGQYLGGYVAADQLIQQLDAEKAGT